MQTTRGDGAQRRRTIPFDEMIVYFCLVMYALCFQMQSPLLPYLVKSLGANTTSYGYIQTLVSVAQLCGGMLAGSLIDAYGSKTMLLTSFVASFLCYAITASSTTMLHLYISRLPTLLQHAMLASRTYVSLNSDETTRAQKIGYVGFCYGVGFALGPALGGLLSSFSLRTASYLGSLGSILCFIIIWTLVPSTPVFTEGEDQNQATKNPSSEGLTSSLNQYRRVLSNPAVLKLTGLKTLCGLALALFHSTFSLATAEQFNLSAQENGLLMSYVGVLMAFAQGVLIRETSQRFKEDAIVTYSLLTLAFSYALLVVVSNIWHLVLLLVPMVCSGLLLSNINTSQLSKCVSKADNGTMMGIDMGLSSGVRIISPLVGAFMLNAFGIPAIGISCCVLVLISFVFL